MELSDFEKDIQRKLREREIVPSETAWEKLSEQLPHKKAKKTVTWYWVAATVVLLVTVGFFINNKNEQQQPSVVNTEKEKQKTITPIHKPVTKEDTVVNNVVHQSLHPTKKEKSAFKSNSIIAKEITNEVKTPEELVVETTEEKKVTEIVSHFETLQNSGKEITEAMVDSLLIQAQRELAVKRTFKDPSGKVDAMALLSEVENDLDKSFRDKVFEALQDGFIVVKTAVADRN